MKSSKEVDVLLTLQQPGDAPKGLASTASAFPRGMDLVGRSLRQLPAHVGWRLPVGATVIARYGD